jgi:hypothetical protein
VSDELPAVGNRGPRIHQVVACPSLEQYRTGTGDTLLPWRPFIKDTRGLEIATRGGHHDHKEEEPRHPFPPNRAKRACHKICGFRACVVLRVQLILTAAFVPACKCSQLGGNALLCLVDVGQFLRPCPV